VLPTPPPPYYCPYLCPYCTPRKTVLPTSHTGYAAAAAAAAPPPAPGGAAAASRGIGRGNFFSGCALHCRRARARESSHLGAAEGAVVCYEITAPPRVLTATARAPSGAATTAPRVSDSLLRPVHLVRGEGRDVSS